MADIKKIFEYISSGGFSLFQKERKGLTTGKAPFIESAQSRKEMFIHQPYELYTGENQEAWRALYKRIYPRWEQYANPIFLEGVHLLYLDPDNIPKLSDVNTFLEPLTGFQAKPVSGYIPGGVFFDCLRRREFPTTITIRDAAHLDYLPEPDIFHDVAGHVPMHTSEVFAANLQGYGQLVLNAAELVSAITDKEDRNRRLANIIKGLSRVFWFTFEFGIMQLPKEFRAYGSGLLSSYGELEHCITSPDVQRKPIQLDWMINQYFEIDHYQPLLFYIEEFDQLFDILGSLKKMVEKGELDNVAPGKPEVTDIDLVSFFEAIEEKK